MSLYETGKDVKSAFTCTAEQLEEAGCIGEEDMSSSLLCYEQHMLSELLHSEGLLVCGKGVGYEKVLLTLLAMFRDATTMVLVVNCTEPEKQSYISRLGIRNIQVSSITPAERAHAYGRGGVQFLDASVLAMDLLSNRVPVQFITGIIVVRAHTIRESCPLAFALRLYRQKNKVGFVKAFSKNAEGFTYGHGHVEDVMRNSFLTELFLWPRSHATVKKELTSWQPIVVEMQIPMSQNMILLQTYILDLMKDLVRNIQSLNPNGELREVTVENCISKKFPKTLKAELDAIWYQLCEQSKRIVADLRVLRTLMVSTLHHDAVACYTATRRFRSTEYAFKNSGWTLLDSADKMFKTAKDRVYNKDDEFDPEHCPKWEALTKVLRQDIPTDIKETAKNIRSKDERLKHLHQQVKILILCQDGNACYQLAQYLTQGPHRYLFYKALQNDVDVSKAAESYRRFPTEHRSGYTVKSVEPKQQAVPEASAGSSKRSLFREKISKRHTDAAKKAEEDLKDQDEGESSMSKMEAELLESTQQEQGDNRCFKDSYILTMSQKGAAERTNSDAGEEDYQCNVTQMECGEFELVSTMENEDITKIMTDSNKPMVFIRTFKSEINGTDSLDRTLETIKPRYIVMYHSHVTALRQIEVYAARQQRHELDRARVFVIIHSGTAEEQSYLTAVRREKQAFELLIDTKQNMVVPEHRDGKSEDAIIMLQKKQEDPTSPAGGDQAVATESFITPRIIVDKREFRSDLPCLIHRRGIEVVPMTITVGDYILSPEIAVERKSVPDFVTSLKSGRLYHQCDRMTRYYAKPILLIEFDRKTQFHHQQHLSKVEDALACLVVNYPAIQVMWSPSATATAKLYELIKRGKQEPDPVKASSLGINEEVDGENFIQNLPGIDSTNIANVVAQLDRPKDLDKKSLEELAELLGCKIKGKMLWDSLN